MWHENGKRVVEVGGDGLAAPVVVHRVSRELISPNTIFTILGLVVVDEELAIAVTVQIDHGHVVGAKDVCIVDGFALDKGTVTLRNTVHTDSFIEEMSCENDNFTRVLGELLHFDANVSDVSEDVLSPFLR